MVPHKLKTLFVNGTSHGIGMLQADPTNQTEYEPMFLHSNIIKWSIRNFMCIGCKADSMDPVALSAIENSESAIHHHLIKHRRIFNLEDMEVMKIDPEPLIWESLEHTACRSVWRSRGLCTRTREHMEQTFGYRFQRGWFASIIGPGEQICLTQISS